jgi:hypothetical protein
LTSSHWAKVRPHLFLHAFSLSSDFPTNIFEENFTDKKKKYLSISLSEEMVRKSKKENCKIGSLTQHNVGKYVIQIPSKGAKSYRNVGMLGFFSKFLTFVILDFQWKKSFACGEAYEGRKNGSYCYTHPFQHEVLSA